MPAQLFRDSGSWRALRRRLAARQSSAVRRTRPDARCRLLGAVQRAPWYYRHPSRSPAGTSPAPRSSKSGRQLPWTIRVTHRPERSRRTVHRPARAREQPIAESGRSHRVSRRPIRSGSFHVRHHGLPLGGVLSIGCQPGDFRNQRRAAHAPLASLGQSGPDSFRLVAPFAHERRERPFGCPIQSRSDDSRRHADNCSTVCTTGRGLIGRL